MELETLYGNEPELMGRSFLRRRLKPKFLLPGYAQYRVAKSVLNGDEPELMGRSFWKRQAQIVSRNVRPISSKLLDIGAKNPLTSGYVAGFRTATSLINPSGGKIKFQQIKPSGIPEPVIPETPNIPGKSPTWSTAKKITVFGGLLTITIIGFLIAKPKNRK